MPAGPRPDRKKCIGKTKIVDIKKKLVFDSLSSDSPAEILDIDDFDTSLISFRLSIKAKQMAKSNRKLKKSERKTKRKRVKAS